jgi:hypothetical protein
MRLMPELLLAATLMPHCPFCQCSLLCCDLRGTESVNDPSAKCYCVECKRQFRLPKIEVQLLDEKYDG